MPNAKEGELVDGTSTFLGGMDASLNPSDIRKDQYYRGCNVLVPRSGGGLKNRGGIHHQSLEFSNDEERSIYENNPIQGESSFQANGETFLLACVSGYVFQFSKTFEGTFRVCIINENNRMQANTRAVWFTPIPGGCILNDGVRIPLFCERNSASVASGLTPGKMGAYVQRRFFYVDPEGKFIQASDYDNPLSIENSLATNIHGFPVPQNEDTITAIGRQKQTLNYIEGGVLVFSTENDIYSVDVRGAREDWEVVSTNLGKVSEAITSIGATSPFSFEPFNTNLYFRAFDYGICDLRRSQYQFTGEGDFVSQSIEIDYWLEHDTDWMLNQAYTRKYKTRLYTTIAPQLNEDGKIFWNGLVVMHPSSDNAEQSRHSRRFEGIITGVRPWCVTVTTREAQASEMFIHSYDHDSKNRLYKYVDHADYDINELKQRIEIESWIETRGYDFGYKEEVKDVSKRWYTIESLSRDTKVDVFTRPENDGEWKKQYSVKHRVNTKLSSGRGFCPQPLKPEGRKRVNVSDEPDNDSDNPGYIGGTSFCSRQYRLEIKGGFRLKSFLAVAKVDSPEQHVLEQSEEDENDKRNTYTARKDFSYLISSSNNLSLR